jgi:hypothetical protein
MCVFKSMQTSEDSRVDVKGNCVMPGMELHMGGAAAAAG